MSSQSGVERVFNDKFMGLVSIAIVPFFLADLLTPGAETFALVAESIIVMIFSIEYGSKLSKSKNKSEFVKDRWQILNLIIILSLFTGITISLFLAITVLPTTLFRLLRLFRSDVSVPRTTGSIQFHRWLLRTWYYHIFVACMAVILVSSYIFLLVEPNTSSILGQLMPQTSLGVGLSVTIGLTILVLFAYTISRITDLYNSSDDELETIRQDIHRLDVEIRKRPIQKREQP